MKNYSCRLPGAVPALGLAVMLMALPATSFAATAQAGEIDEVTVDLEMPFPDNPERIGHIMQVIEENAMDVRNSADRLTDFNEQPGEYSWLAHNWRLNRIQQGLAELQDALARLDEGTNLLLEGQNQALDVIRPEAVELEKAVRNLTAHVNQHPDWDMDYRTDVQMVRDHADRIVAAVGLAESLIDVRAYLDDLESED